jgi:hypothetical protein
MKLLPVPPDTLSLKVADGTAELLTDGTWELGTAVSSEIDIKGVASKPKDGKTPVDSLKNPDWGNFIDTSRITPTVQQLAHQVTADKKSDYDKAVAIQNEISRRIVYNLDAEETPPKRDPVEYALFEEKEGYCTSFASAMVLMARAVGLPARYVQGYLTDDRRREPNGKYQVTDADYHAWAEVFFKDFGWVTFDPTLGAVAKEGEGLGDVGDNRPWYQRGIISFVLDILIVATIVAMILSSIAFVRNRRRFSNLRTEVERVYVSYSRALERTSGRRRNVGQTADEFLESVRPSLNGSYDSAKGLNERFVRAMYSAESVAPESVATLRADVKAFCTALKVSANQAKKGKS